MARRVFFSFHYGRDIWRINPVRNSWVGRDREQCGFWDNSLWESTKRQGEVALKRLINDGLWNTSVTAVLIGAETYSRRWVRYEIVKSLERGNGLLGIQIHNIEDSGGVRDLAGPNPFEFLYYEMDSYRRTIYISEWDGRDWISYKDMPSISTASIPYISRWGVAEQLSKFVPIYNWNYDNGYRNIGAWVQSAAIAAGR